MRIPGNTLGVVAPVFMQTWGHHGSLALVFMCTSRDQLGDSSSVPKCTPVINLSRVADVYMNPPGTTLELVAVLSTVQYAHTWDHLRTNSCCV
jgi:hypothetical protein